MVYIVPGELGEASRVCIVEELFHYQLRVIHVAHVHIVLGEEGPEEQLSEGALGQDIRVVDSHVEQGLSELVVVVGGDRLVLGLGQEVALHEQLLDHLGELVVAGCGLDVLPDLGVEELGGVQKGTQLGQVVLIHAVQDCGRLGELVGVAGLVERLD